MLLKKKTKFVPPSQTSTDSGVASQGSQRSTFSTFRNPLRNFVIPQMRRQSPLKPHGPILSSPSPRSRPAPRHLTSPGAVASRLSPRCTPRVPTSRTASPAAFTSTRPSPGNGKNTAKKKLHEQVSKNLKDILNSDAFLETANKILDNSDELSEFCETLEAAGNDVGCSTDVMLSPVRMRRRRRLLLQSSDDEESSDFPAERRKVQRKEALSKKQSKKTEGEAQTRQRCELKKKATKSKERKVKSPSATAESSGVGSSAEAPIATVNRKRSRQKKRAKTTSERNEEFQFRIFSTWVECVRCRKWRYLPSVFDPASLPEDWVCGMNEDRQAARNGCLAPEGIWDAETEEKSLLVSYTEGSLVWARVQGYPMWPAMVDRDPDMGVCYELPLPCDWEQETDGAYLPEPSYYHVSFLDRDPSRAWISRRNLKPFHGVADMKEHDFKVGRRDFRSLVRETAVEAEKSLELDLKDRIKKYGFAFRWKNIDNQWTKSHKKPKRGGKDDVRKKRKRKSMRDVERELEKMEMESSVLNRKANKILESIEQQVIRASQQ